jgi:hypothetical protein
MDESLEGLAWLISTLEGISAVATAMTGGIWPLQAPQGALPPYIVVTPMGGHDVYGLAPTRLMWEGPYQVRFWGYATGSDALTAAGNSADAALHGAKHLITPSGHAEIVSSLRENPLPVQPDWDGQQLRIGIGGLYRLQVRSLT